MHAKSDPAASAATQIVFLHAKITASLGGASGEGDGVAAQGVELQPRVCHERAKRRVARQSHPVSCLPQPQAQGNERLDVATRANGLWP